MGEELRSLYHRRQDEEIGVGKPIIRVSNSVTGLGKDDLREAERLK